MRALKGSLVAVICLFLGFIAIISLAQQAPDEFPMGELGAGANLVVTSVSGPPKAFLNQTISVTYTVKNQGDAASGAYKVGLYLSADKTIDPATDRLLKNVTFAAGMVPGKSKQTTTKVVVPNYHVDGLSGKYYFGAAVATSKKASSKQVSILRYSLTDNNATVTDHQTGLIWQGADDGTGRNWADANQYCADLVLDGKADLRLPSIDELESIIDYSRDHPSIDPVFSCRSDGYWSSSTYVYNPDYAWYVGFGSGGVYTYNKTYSDYYFRCVRGGPGSFGTLTVEKSGSGTGKVRSTPAGIDCGISCSAPYAAGTKVTLKALADSGSTFTGWPGSGCSGAGDCVIIVDGDLTVVSATFALNVPGAPTGVVATAGNAQATVTFVAPASDGGSPIISYTVTSSPGGRTATGASSPITVSGLTNGTAYTFTVTATNAIGTGPASSPSNSVTPVYPASRYVDNGDGTVTNNETGLIWQKDDDGTLRNWPDAVAYCDSLVLPSPDGYSDWRVPRIDELETVVDYSRFHPAIDPVFAGRSGKYWSSSTDVNTGTAWTVGFDDGGVHTGFNASYVRCVRGGPFWSFDTSVHLETSSPTTVRDTYWGYVWQKGDSGDNSLTWDQANFYCNGLDLDGYTDWRLPDIEALLTIVNYTRFNPALSTDVFQGHAFYYWSSTTHYYADAAWFAAFSNGDVGATNKKYGGYVRCVRSGP